MARIGLKLRSLQGGRVAFMCPGCGELHQITVDGAASDVQGPVWGYNQNPDAPTFTPSVLVRGVRNNLSDADWDALDKLDVKADREKILSDSRFNFVCHSFVRDGRIQFLNDCTHSLAGQTVDLPDLEGEICAP